jgi:hypothetical protein
MDAGWQPEAFGHSAYLACHLSPFHPAWLSRQAGLHHEPAPPKGTPPAAVPARLRGTLASLEGRACAHAGSGFSWLRLAGLSPGEAARIFFAHPLERVVLAALAQLHWRERGHHIVSEPPR